MTPRLWPTLLTEAEEAALGLPAYYCADCGAFLGTTRRHSWFCNCEGAGAGKSEVTG